VADGLVSDRVLHGEVLVVSPHLDDAAFSLGAGLARAARSGARVRVLTVFGCDPDSSAPAAWWDASAGFPTEGAAAKARRAEDEQASRMLGVTPEWLSFSDASYERDQDYAAIREAVLAAAADSDVVLLPGFPLHHIDHIRLTQLLLADPLGSARTALYVEQPYAKWDGGRRPWHRPSLPRSIAPLVDRPVDWISLRASRRDRRAKIRASLAYTSQLPLLAGKKGPLPARLLPRRIALYEALRGGEAIAWLE
jgi:LmbE family N-acetylglucosaminyl deacetylase